MSDQGMQDQELHSDDVEAVGADVEAVEHGEASEPTHESAEPTQEPTPAYSQEDAEEARLFGWKAPDEWKGDRPSGYIDDPTRYMERVQNSKAFKVMASRADEIQREADERLRKIETVNKMALERQRKIHQAELDEIKAGKLRAVSEADTEVYEALDRREKALIETAREIDAPLTDEVKKAPQTVDPYIQSYAATDQGAWLKNPVLTEAGARIVAAGGLNAATTEAQVRYAEAELRKLYPTYFTSEKATPVKQRVDAGGLGGGAARQTGFSKLPADAKSTFANFVKEGLFKDTDADRKAYADEYYSA